MKTSLFSALTCLFLASLAPAADLIVEPKVLTPKSTLELRFDTPMVDKSRVGTVEKNSPLVANPAVEGEFKWTSTRSGQFHFVKPLAFGAKFHFALRAGLQDAAGKAVEAEEFDELETEKFRSVVEWRDYPYNFKGVQQRIPYYIIQFSDAVDATEAAKQIYFTTQKGHEKIPATARLATGKDFKHRHETEVAPTWEEQMAGVKPVLNDDEVRPNALVVQSKEPLSVGDNWTVVIPKTFGNLAKTATLGADRNVVWGNVVRLTVNNILAEPHFDSAHSIELEFNKSLIFSNEETSVAVKRLSPLVRVEPAVPNMEFSVSYNHVSIAGDFELEKNYTVTISSDIPASDELGLEKDVKQTIVFHPSQAFVSTSAFQNKQLSGGKGIFDIYAANFKEVHIRVKKLSDGELVKARQLYTDSYETWDDDGKNGPAKKIKATPFEKFPGTVIYDKSIANTKPLEKASRLDLNWRDVLGQTPGAPVFIELEAAPQEGAPAGNIVNRAIVEFTDIGLLVKNSGKDALVYAFSLRSGEPTPEVELTFMDKERGFVCSAKTDSKGMATVASDGAFWVLAKRGEDCTAINCGNEEGHINMWRHGISYAWNSPWKKHLETFVFADRPVYKPGETAHVKAIARSRVGDELGIDAKPITAQLTVTDPRGRTILTKAVTFTANGTWADDITFPETLTGFYSVNLNYPKAQVSGAA
ncbi:MAG: MG2 domain-containing protein, partial [Verrucomicrobiaceae bacterium]